MSDLINNQQDAIDILKANYPSACYEQLREAVDAAIIALQSADPEQKIGKWIENPKSKYGIECSECGEPPLFEGTVFKFTLCVKYDYCKSNFCPNCGERMEVKE